MQTGPFAGYVPYCRRNLYRLPVPERHEGLDKTTREGHLAKGSSCRCEEQMPPITVAVRIESPVANQCSHGTLTRVNPQGSRLDNCYSNQDLLLRRLNKELTFLFQSQRFRLSTTLHLGPSPVKESTGAQDVG